MNYLDAEQLFVQLLNTQDLDQQLQCVSALLSGNMLCLPFSDHGVNPSLFLHMLRNFPTLFKFSGFLLTICGHIIFTVEQPLQERLGTKGRLLVPPGCRRQRHQCRLQELRRCRYARRTLSTSRLVQPPIDCWRSAIASDCGVG